MAINKILFQPTFKVKKSEEDALYIKEKPKSSRKTLIIYTIILAIVLVIIVFLFHKTFYINQESQRTVEMRKDNLVRITGPGLYFKFLFRKYIQYPINIQKISFENVSIDSSDKYQFNSQLVLLYQIPEDKIKYIHRKHIDYKKKLEVITTETFKNKLATVRMIDVPMKRQEIESDVQENIRQKIKQLLKINLRSFHFHYDKQPEEFLRKLAAQRMAAEDKILIEKTKDWNKKQASLRELVDAEAKTLIEKAQYRASIPDMEQIEAIAKP
jgi:regulator of protease activity HflC (stomatin/prohibitin superfamily)